MTEEEAAAFLGVSKKTLTRLRARNDRTMPYLIVGGRYRYEKDALVTWARDNAQAQLDERFARAARVRAQSKRIGKRKFF